MSDKKKRVERRAQERDDARRGQSGLAPSEWDKLTPEQKRKAASRLK